MIRLMLVDDHAVVRAGYRRLLDAESWCRVVAEAADGDEAYARLLDGGIDVAIVDLSLRGGSGLDAIRRMLAREPALRVLVLSMHDGASHATQALRAGALGYMTKRSEPEAIFDAIRGVALGRRMLAAEIAQTLARAAIDGDDLASRLTLREFEVLRLLAAGEPSARVADLLHLSPKTVLNHLSAIRQKLGAQSDLHLFRIAASHGLVEPVAGG
ncbi:response regulator [Derxia gummosa]|uniref:Response regulator n=1 Tax=Derxia gummosa DSM 723 TaxID=1121388 RepID=A0A8B6X1Q7_9BURK|nr:response regulator transcription factor [Derxia gummosa]